VRNAKDRPGGLDGLKNRSGKCEGPAEGGGSRRGKESEWKMGRTGRGGGSTRYITHLCIMHGAHTRLGYFIKNNKITESLNSRSGKCEGSAGGN
jgi:hypothetical protein